jgi:hypothetical protein
MNVARAPFDLDAIPEGSEPQAICSYFPAPIKRESPFRATLNSRASTAHPPIVTA